MGLSRNLFLWISVVGLSLVLVASQSHGSGSPPSHGVICSPTPPPAHHGGGGGGYYHSPPSTPVYDPPPTTTITPVTPVAPPPPAPVDPGSGSGSGPFPCTYWGSHPRLIWGALGWWGTVGGVFGVPTLPGVTADPTSFTLQHALNSTGSDGYTSLYREAAASFLNSLSAPKRFHYTTAQVRSSFVSALRSEKAAAHQARLFHLANQGRLKLY